jgi:hypothetical protein
MYQDYYRNQAFGLRQHGGFDNMPFFRGSSYQRGHGLGSIFGNIFRGLRAIMPSVFKTVGRHALTTGVNIANDVLEGKKLKESVRQHGLQGLKSAAGEVAPVLLDTIKRSAHDNVDQSGSGLRKRKSTFKQRRQHKRQRKSQDIFN